MFKEGEDEPARHVGHVGCSKKCMHNFGSERKRNRPLLKPK